MIRLELELHDEDDLIEMVKMIHVIVSNVLEANK